MNSIIIPVYNGESYISRCLDSVLNNTFTDFEIIIVVNGSTDKTSEICHTYALKDARVHVYCTDVKGVSHARNMGLDLCSGDRIAFVDADDYISPYMLEHFNRVMDETDCDICFARYAEGTDISYSFADFPGNRTVYHADSFLYHTYLTPQLDFVIVCNKLFKRNAIGALRFDETLRVTEDRNLLVRTVCQCSAECELDEITYYYWHGNQSSASSIPDGEQRMHAVYSLQKDLSFFNTTHPQNTAWQEYVSCCLYENAMLRYRKAKRMQAKDLAKRAKRIANDAMKCVKCAKNIPSNIKYRLLADRYAPWLLRLAARILGK